MRASLRLHYGINLSTVREEFTAGELADLVMWLPTGSPLWLATGGAASLTGELSALRWVQYLLQAMLYQASGNKGKKPEPPKDPEWAFEREQREMAQDAKARAWLRRQEQLES